MGEAYDRGKAFELKVQKLTSKILHLETKRDSRSGAGLHKQDIRDRYDLLPVFIECKDHETIKPKAWWREADAKSSFGQAPIVVFPDEEEVLCVMRYTDLLQFIKEIADWKETAEDYRTAPALDYKPAPVNVKKAADNLKPVVETKISRGAKVCKNGHIVDDYGYCMQKGCPYSRGYVKKKVKK